MDPWRNNPQKVRYNIQVELFLRVIQGAYAYLLIALISIVSGLFLALLWLLVRRTKEAALAAGKETAIAVSVVAPPPAPFPTAADTVLLDQLGNENNKLKGKIEQLESEIKTSSGSEEKAKQLNEKVAYLESKLIEYEILQEEIGTLSALKLENERLKQSILNPGFEAQVQSPPATPSAIATPEPAPPMVVSTPAEPAKASGGQLAKSEGEPDEDNLDALLAEIDKLTTQEGDLRQG